MIKKIPYLILLCCICKLQLVAQSGSVVLKSVVPPGPNAGSIGKYGEVPVTMYSGIPEISIPIYEINAGRIKIPLQLSYHSGGIKVEEAASWVGLGWSLNGPGMITRTIRGLPDDTYTVQGTEGYMNPSLMHVNRLLQGPDQPATQDSIIWYNKRLTKCVTRQADGEPDLFQLNIPGLSCKFYYNQQRKQFITDPASKVQINYSGILLGAKEWQVIDQNGLVYTFTFQEKTFTPWDVRNYTIETITAWLLTSIYDPVYNRTVNFTYSNINLVYNSGVTQIAYDPIQSASFNSSLETIYHESNISQGRLSSISFDEGSVEFNVNATNRLDLTGDKALNNIVIKNILGERINKYVLHTSYFTHNRLRLDSLESFGKNDVEKQMHKFEYNDIACGRFSFSQDQWGYYNGEVNTRLVKNMYFTHGSNVISLAGGNREVNPTVNQMGILKKIVYPTGGINEFEYETNRYTIDNAGGYEPQNLLLYANACEQVCNMQGAYYYSYTEIPFTINMTNGLSQGVWGEVIQLNNDYNIGCPNGIVSCRVVGVNGTSGTYFLNGPNQGFNLPNGDYLLIAEFQHCYQDYFIDAKAILHYTNLVYTGNTVITKLVGGLRIKEIKTIEPITENVQVKRYEYVKENNSQASSGIVPSPIIDYYLVWKIHTINPPEPAGVFIKRQSYTAIPLATTKGAYIGYSRVVEKRINSGNYQGYSVYEFTNTDGFPDIQNPLNEMPYKPVTNRDYMRGMLLTHKVFGVMNGVDVVLQSTENEYSTIADTTNGTISYGFIGRPLFSAGGGVSLPIEDNETHEYASTAPQIGIYKEQADKLILARTTKKSYDSQNSNNVLTEINEFDHAYHNFEVKKIVNYQSGSSEKKIQKVKFPNDYTISGTTFNSNTQRIIDLIAANNINQTIESNTFIEKNNSQYFLKGQLTLFNTDQRPSNISVLQVQEPSASIAEMAVIQNGNFTINSNAKNELDLLAYNNEGMILSQRLSNNIIHSYVYDYAGKTPIASVINASHDEIAYTSFETDETGGFTCTSLLRTVGGITGKKAYNLANGNLTKNTGISLNQNYILSYWRNGAALSITGSTQVITGNTINGWTYYEHRLTNINSITISGTGLIDELRFLPANAQMTTYTYEPMVGITTQCDANNKIAFYEYDSFNRLKLIKDQDGKILKVFDYKYQANTNQ